MIGAFCWQSIHDSQILAEARKVDPATERTIPVLTKPDLIDAGAEASVEQLLHGRKTDEFKMGFHMVKGRGQKDLNECLSIEDGLVRESHFFLNNDPWRNTHDKSLFGTKNLRVKLARLQIDLIRSSFASIVSEMKEKSQEASSDLKALGEIPANLVEKRVLYSKVKDEICGGLSGKY